MNIIKAIAIGSLFLLQGISFCAQAEATKFDQLQDVLKPVPDTVTLKCTDGVIPNVPVSLLIDKFGYFEAYFRNWGVGRFAYMGKEVGVDGTVQDMRSLLSFVNPSSRSSYDLQGDNDLKTLVLLELAHWLCLKEEEMNLLINSIKLSLQKELYSKSAYEKFLKDGDSSNISIATTLDNNLVAGFSGIDMAVQVPHDSMVSISLDGHYGVVKFDGGYQVIDRNALGEEVLLNIPLMSRFDDVVQFSPNSKLVWIGTSFGKGQLWDIESQILLINSDEVWNFVIFSSDSKWISIFKCDSSVELWEIAAKRLHHVFSFISSVGFSLDSQRIAVKNLNGLSVFNLTSGEKDIIAESVNNPILFSFDGKKVGYIKDRSTFELYDLEKKEIIVKIPGVTDFAFTANSSVLVLEKQNQIVFYNLITKQETFICSGMFLGASSDREAFVIYDDNYSYYFTTNVPVHTMQGGGWFCFGFNADNSLVAKNTEKNKITVFEVVTGSHVFDISLEGMPVGSNIKQIAFGLSGTFLIVECFLRGQGVSSFVINLPLEKTALHLSAEERYLCQALTSRVEDVGHKLDALSLPEELEVMFDRFPRAVQDEILTTEGRIKRDLVRDVQGIYGRMRTIFGIGKEPQAAPSVDYTAVD
jgi:WD40 repeat protein